MTSTIFHRYEYARHHLCKHVLMADAAVFVANEQVRSFLVENVLLGINPSRLRHHIDVGFGDVKSVNDVRARDVKDDLLVHRHP